MGKPFRSSNQSITVRTTPIRQAALKAKALISKRNDDRVVVTENKKRLQYRSSLKGVILPLKKFTFTPSQVECLHKHSPFWKLLELIINDRIDSKAAERARRSIEEVLLTYDRDTHSFKIGGKNLVFTKQDLASAFGIDGGSKSICENTGDYSSCNLYKYLKSFEDKPSSSICLQLLGDLVNKTEPNNDELICQLVTIYLLCNLLMCTKGLAINWGYIKYIDDMNRMKEYNWAEHIHDRLMNSIRENQTRNVTGAVMALMYWLMESFPIQSQMTQNVSLWCQKWNVGWLFSRTDKGKSSVIGFNYPGIPVPRNSKNA